jgi:hypothetical protein
MTPWAPAGSRDVRRWETETSLRSLADRYTRRMNTRNSAPVGTMGKLRNMKGLTWVLIFALLALTLGGTIILFIVEYTNPLN